MNKENVKMLRKGTHQIIEVDEKEERRRKT